MIELVMVFTPNRPVPEALGRSTVPHLKEARLLPTFFGQPELFGVHHEATPGPVGRQMGVLLCPSIGHEHTRAARAFRMLAEALARVGHPVLRFDYRGLGDSSGEFGHVTVGDWIDDIRQGLRQLVEYSRCAICAVVGLRVGATLAVHAIQRLDDPGVRVKRLVLWDPVLSGKDFLELTTALYRRFLGDPGRFPQLAYLPRSVTPQRVSEQLLGYSYPAPLREGLCELNLRGLDPWPRVDTSIVLSQPNSDCDALVARLGQASHVASCVSVSGTDGAWSEYLKHERPLRAGRIIPNIVASLRSGGT